MTDTDNKPDKPTVLPPVISGAGKGDGQRPADKSKWDDGYERTFGKGKSK